jgi:hypothetical protein
MPIMLADYDPGTLTGFYVFCLFGLAAGFCLICGGVMMVFKKWQAFRRWIFVAGIAVVLGILLASLAVAFGKRFHWL